MWGGGEGQFLKSDFAFPDLLLGPLLDTSCMPPTKRKKYSEPPQELAIGQGGTNPNAQEPIECHYFRCASTRINQSHAFESSGRLTGSDTGLHIATEVYQRNLCCWQYRPQRALCTRVDSTADNAHISRNPA